MPTTTTPRTGFPGRTISPRTWSARAFYDPVERGFERDLRKRLDYFARLRASGYMTARRFLGEIAPGAGAEPPSDTRHGHAA